MNINNGGTSFMVKEIEPLALRELLKKGTENLELIDVREPSEYAQFHLKNSKLMPLSTVMNRVNEIDWNKDVIFVCRSGNRSGMAASAMASHYGKASANLKYGLQICIADGGSEFLSVAGR